MIKKIVYVFGFIALGTVFSYQVFREKGDRHPEENQKLVVEESQELMGADLAAIDDAHWQEEQISNQLVVYQLRVLAEILRGEEANPEDCFTGDAVIGELNPLKGDAVEVYAGVTREDWVGPFSEYPIERWLSSVDEYHGEFKRIRWSMIKPTRVRMTDYGVEAIVKYRLNDELTSGGLRHDQGYWKAEIVRLDKIAGLPEQDLKESGTEEGCGPGDGNWRIRKFVPDHQLYTLESSAPQFSDVTREAIARVRLPEQALPEAIRGIALADLDHDDDLDIVVGSPPRVLTNDGTGSFDEAVGALGVNLESGGGGYLSVLVADFDNDGDNDIFLGGRRRKARLCLQTERGFVSADIDVSFSDAFVFGLSSQDIDGDGFLDVFLSGYGSVRDPGPNDLQNAMNGTRNQLLRGRPNGQFQDVTSQWGLQNEGVRWSFQGAFGDPDEDGDIDLYVANDFGPNVFYRRQSADPVKFVAEIEPPSKVRNGFSMSATWADLDGDLDLDLYVSNMSSTAAGRLIAMDGDSDAVDDMRRTFSAGNSLLFNERGRLIEGGDSRGARNAGWAWGTAVFDFDRDGDLDIHCVNGYISSATENNKDL